MLSAITAIIAGCGRAKRPADRTDAAVWSKPDMSTKESSGGKPSVTIREEQTRNQPLLDATVTEQDGQLEVFIEPDWMLNGTDPDAWYKTAAFIEFDSLEELA